MNPANLPLKTRIRLLWTSLTLAGLGLIILWFFTLNNQAGFSDNKKSEEVGYPVSNNYVKVDWAKVVDGKLEVYFKVKNDTANILNFSEASGIALKAGDKEFLPAQLKGRQEGEDFVKKVLSNTQASGIAIFEGVEQTKDLKLDFKNLYFESKPADIFIEEITFDVDNSQEPTEIRK